MSPGLRGGEQVALPMCNLSSHLQPGLSSGALGLLVTHMAPESRALSHSQSLAGPEVPGEGEGQGESPTHLLLLPLPS